MTLVAEAKVNTFVLNSHNKLQFMPIKNKTFLYKGKTAAFWQKNSKTLYFGKITVAGLLSGAFVCAGCGPWP